jgi:hypothetical protein
MAFYQRSIQILFVICVLLCSCNKNKPELPQIDASLISSAGKFTLYVSNQSFAIDPVDIVVVIDGKCVVSQLFKCKDQHNWQKFCLSLAPGTHRLEVRSKIGDTQLSRSFEVSDKHWAVLNFWYYPKDAFKPMDRQFSFDIQDEPMYFV